MRGTMWKGAMTAAALGVVAASWGPGPAVSSPAPDVGIECPTPGHARLATGPALADGVGVWASTGRGLVRVDSVAGTEVATEDRAGVVRHVTVRPGVGTAYVSDRAGGDVVVAVTPAGVRRYPQRHEVLHPAWSEAGDLAWSLGRAIRVRSADGRFRSYAAPGATMVFSPVFTTRRSLIVVASSPPTAAVPEGDRHNDLWRLRLDGGIWRRLTSFTADADRWSVIRTPFATDGGAIEYVRVVGRASATRDPRFELWRFDAGRAMKMRDLAGERYLAGLSGDARWWNVPTEGGLRMGILREGPDGAERLVGCGAVSVDPSWLVDPDRAVNGRKGLAARTSDAAHGEHATERGGPPSADLAILVGDFASIAEAEQAADVIRTAAPVEVEAIGHPAAPLAIRPGAFAVVYRLALDADAQLALDDLRARIPEFASMSWVVSL